MDNKNSELIPLVKAAKLTNYSQEYVSLLCRRGKMKGKKMGRNWFTTKEWVDDYINRTNGSGEIVIPVRIKNETKNNKINEKNQADRPNAMSTNFFLLTGKLIIAVVVFGILISGVVFLKQGVLNGIIGGNEGSERQILKPSGNIIYPDQYNKAISSNKTKSKPVDANEAKSGRVVGVSNEKVNEKPLFSPIVER